MEMELPIEKYYDTETDNASLYGLVSMLWQSSIQKYGSTVLEQKESRLRDQQQSCISRFTRWCNFYFYVKIIGSVFYIYEDNFMGLQRQKSLELRADQRDTSGSLHLLQIPYRTVVNRMELGHHITAGEQNSGC